MILAFVTALGLGLAPQSQNATPPLDPSCFAAVAWAVDPEAEPMQVFGCREPSDIPAANAQGWVVYEPADGGFVWGKMESISTDDVWTFRVVWNGGGSGTFEYIVTGEPDGNGIIQSPRVTALPAS
ncbi:MAG: hypothetical protein K2X61_12655 [Caulobacteraceae bacterium]|nr:hypothetical protein [Caulobacteraceae bacterium]